MCARILPNPCPSPLPLRPFFLSVSLSPTMLSARLVDLPEIKGNHRKFRTLVTSYIGKKIFKKNNENFTKKKPIIVQSNAFILFFFIFIYSWLSRFFWECESEFFCEGFLMCLFFFLNEWIMLMFFFITYIRHFSLLSSFFALYY